MRSTQDPVEPSFSETLMPNIREVNGTSEFPENAENGVRLSFYTSGELGVRASLVISVDKTWHLGYPIRRWLER